MSRKRNETLSDFIPEKGYFVAAVRRNEQMICEHTCIQENVGERLEQMNQRWQEAGAVEVAHDIRSGVSEPGIRFEWQLH